MCAQRTTRMFNRWGNEWQNKHLNVDRNIRNDYRECVCVCVNCGRDYKCDWLMHGERFFMLNFYSIGEYYRDACAPFIENNRDLSMVYHKQQLMFV